MKELNIGNNWYCSRSHIMVRICTAGFINFEVFTTDRTKLELEQNNKTKMEDLPHKIVQKIEETKEEDKKIYILDCQEGYFVVLVDMCGDEYYDDRTDVELYSVDIREKKDLVKYKTKKGA